MSFSDYTFQFLVPSQHNLRGGQRLQADAVVDRTCLHSLKLSISIFVTLLSFVTGMGIGTAVY